MSGLYVSSFTPQNTLITNVIVTFLSYNSDYVSCNYEEKNTELRYLNSELCGGGNRITRFTFRILSGEKRIATFKCRILRKIELQDLNLEF